MDDEAKLVTVIEGPRAVEFHAETVAHIIIETCQTSFVNAAEAANLIVDYLIASARPQ